MVATRTRQHAVFATVHTEGANLPMDLLQRIAQNDTQVGGLTPEAYHLNAIKLNEAINRSWINVLNAWHTFQNKLATLSANDAGTTVTRERWLYHLFHELGYGRLLTAKAVEINDKSYAISHSWQHTPIHLVSYKVDLDHMTRTSSGTQRSSPHSLLQEFLNRSDEHLWGIVSNGLKLRILRDNVSLTRQAYVEFDLESMMNGEIYSDFVLLWLLCHESRVEAERPEECWLEKWSRTAQEQGTRALEQLRVGVESAIRDLGSGFLAHGANRQLLDKLRSGQLEAQDYYRQILRLVYRLIVLFVAEDREILFHPEAPTPRRELYTRYYSTTRLRYLAEQHIGTRHTDLFHGLRLVMDKLGNPDGCPDLGLPALNGFLFSRDAIGDLNDCELANYALLAAIRSLAYTSSGRTRRVVDYKNLGSEELGSVYESLLELHPILHIESAKFELASASGNERKTTGSYYTPTSLITCLLDSALDPVLDEAANKATKEEAVAAILNLKVCDPACGSGHFLVAAAHRIAKRLAAIRSEEEEPAPEARRKALRDVVSKCIYGVDINPMSVELCKVSLWMEAIEPGKPLSFLDAHIQCGNSLLGTTPALLKNGIPDEAFETIEGDDKKFASEYKKKNKEQRKMVKRFSSKVFQPWERLGDLDTGMRQFEDMVDTSVAAVHQKEAAYNKLRTTDGYLYGKLWADAWCAAFVWKKSKAFAYPITEEIFRKIEHNPYDLAGWMRDEIQRLAEQYQFFHWHLAFPNVFRVSQDESPENEHTGWSGGFDVVMGNPPWEHAELKEQEWFATRNTEIANAPGAERKRKIEALAKSDPALHTAFLDAKRQQDGWSHLIRNSGYYPLCGRGRINTYAIFAENMRVILSKRGRVGCIVPPGIATDDTNKFFFKNLMESKSLVSFFAFVNEAKLFPGIDHRVKFALLTMGGATAYNAEADFAFGVYHTDDLNDTNRHFSLSSHEVYLFNPNTLTCPIFSSKKDMLITKTIYEHIPVLIKESTSEENPWNITFRQGIFNMTSDSHLFCTREKLEKDGFQLEGNIFFKDDEKYLPLYEAKMINIFNHRFGTYEGATKEDLARGKLPELSVDKLELSNIYPLPNNWVSYTELRSINLYNSKGLLCFRKITNSGVFRTLVGAIIPCVAAGDSLQFILSSTISSIELLCIQANLASFVEDYVTRQKMGGNNLNLFIVKQLPILPPEQYTATCQWNTSDTLGAWISPRALELTYTAWDLKTFARDCGCDGPPFRWDEDRRFLLRCEIDAAYFHLYGIQREDVSYIMDSFRVWKQKEEKEYGEYRTKRVILDIYDRMQRAMESGEPYETLLVPGPADPSVAHPARTAEGTIEELA
ncbi:Eco57I restriction-modification methylase domain-containing protein [Dictyobacter aurantiacus]|uniref:site-specific DNA-methyltransferase (adenine-specific) n=1 Tax=Dictyobacter aurantiacus TaxID=1936993 RepID=A0A401ZMR2_9CHLR|nr:N-6 DNA methylase [Dictyobacter aurantiacus]GCE08143.1 hypothetical protein KDAU_54720 [Dictyobacter aurantiacus]